MRALRFHAAGDLRIENVLEPGPPGPTQVTVAPRWCGICGTDLHEYTSGPIVTPAEPHPLTGAELPQILVLLGTLGLHPNRATTPHALVLREVREATSLAREDRSRELDQVVAVVAPLRNLGLPPDRLLHPRP